MGNLLQVTEGEVGRLGIEGLWITQMGMRVCQRGQCRGISRERVPGAKADEAEEWER